MSVCLQFFLQKSLYLSEEISFLFLEQAQFIDLN